MIDSAPRSPISPSSASQPSMLAEVSPRPPSRRERVLMWAGVVFIYGLLALTLIFIWPGLFGFHTYVGVGTSMGDSIPGGSLLVTRSVAAEDVRVGDVISFRWPNFENPITHRVIDIRSRAGEPVFVTKGDGNPRPDPFVVFNDQQIGRVIFSTPHAGTFLPVIKSLVYVLSFGAGFALWRRRRRRRLATAAAVQFASLEVDPLPLEGV